MGADRLMAALAARASERDGTQGRSGWATVTSYDPATNTARVTYQPDGTLSGWLPILTMAAGSGWSIVFAPPPGTQVFVAPHDGDGEHGVIIGGAHSLANLPPQSFTDPAAQGTQSNAPAGDFLLRHASGAFLRFSGTRVILNGSTEIDVTAPTAKVIASAVIQLLAPSIVAASSTGEAQPVVLGIFESLFNNHTHGGGARPDQQMTSAHLTTNFTAS